MTITAEQLINILDDTTSNILIKSLNLQCSL